MKTKSTAQPLATSGVLLLSALGALTLAGSAVADSSGPLPPATPTTPATPPPSGKPATVTTNAENWTSAVIPAAPIVRLATVSQETPFVRLSPAADPGLERHTHGKIIDKFHADNLDLKTALALFASQNDLNIVPDNDITGTVTLDVHNLPLNQMMRALLEANDCSWQEDEGLIRIHTKETRTFAVNYPRLKRDGKGTSSAQISASTSSGGGGGGSGGSGGSGGGGSGGGGSGGGSSGSSMSLNEDNTTDFWTELKTELNTILSPEGRSSLAINKMAGIIEVTDRPSALNRVENYLKMTAQSINRQVDIEAKIYDVTLNDEFQFGIDWNHVAAAYEGTLGFGTTTLPTAIGSAASGLGSSALGGLNTTPGTAITTAGDISGVGNTLVFNNLNTSAAVTALKTQGSVEVVAAPRIRTMNNQTAVVKVGLEMPFFAESSTTTPGATGSSTLLAESTTITTVTVGTILSITPQISEDGWITMDINPVLTAYVKSESASDNSATAAELSDKQAFAMARVRDNTTVVLGGLIQTEKDKNDNKVPVLGDIPLMGKLFTGNYHASSKNELVIFVTPHIVETSEGSVKFHNLLDAHSDKGKTAAN